MQASASPSLFDQALRLSLVAALLATCLWVMAPFAAILIWSALLAVMLWPVHRWLRGRSAFTNARSATLIGLGAIALVAVPLVLLVKELAVLADGLVAVVRSREPLPPAPQWIADLPAIGTKLSASWDASRGDLGQVLAQNGGFLKAVAGRIAGGLGTMLAAMLATALAAVFLAFGDAASASARRICVRVAGNETRGSRILALTTMTIRGVLQGVVGVAFIQALLIGAGFLLFKVPFSGALILVAFLIGLVQLPALLITVPVIAWAWSHMDSTAAGIFTAYSLLAGFSDQILKPILLGRGIDAPMPVILVGVIGGMIGGGMTGLFIGPVVLAIGFVLFTEWLGGEDPQSSAA